jgi:hypothetical protein
MLAGELFNIFISSLVGVTIVIQGRDNEYRAAWCTLNTRKVIIGKSASAPRQEYRLLKTSCCLDGAIPVSLCLEIMQEYGVV